MMIKEKYIDPFTDFGFKHIFGTKKNKKFLISFLNDLLELDDEIINVEYGSLEKLGLKISDRKAIFDVYCTDEKNNNFIVELQRSEQKYFKDRSIYYTTFPIQEQAKKGIWNYELTKIYFIGILEFVFNDFLKEDIKDDEEYLTEVKLFNTKRKKVFYDKLTYYYLEMPKFRKTEKDLSNHLDKWLFYLNTLHKSQEIPEVLKKEEIFQEAYSVAEFLALSKDQQFAYQQDLKARWDNEACLSFAEEKGMEKGMEKGKKEGIKEGIKEGSKEGIKEGLEKGREEEKIEIAKKLFKKNIDLETIKISTGLTNQELEKIKNDI